MVTVIFSAPDLQFALLLGGTTSRGGAVLLPSPPVILDSNSCNAGSHAIVGAFGAARPEALAPQLQEAEDSEPRPERMDAKEPQRRRASSMTQTMEVMTPSTALALAGQQHSLLLETSPLQLEILDNEIKNLQGSVTFDLTAFH